MVLPKNPYALANPSRYTAFRTKLSKAETQITARLCSVPGRIYARGELAKYFYKVCGEGLLAKRLEGSVSRLELLVACRGHTHQVICRVNARREALRGEARRAE